MGRIKAYWEQAHDDALNDIRFDLYQIYQLKIMLRKTEKESLRLNIKEIKKNILKLVKVYEKRYGDQPDIWKLRREVEYESWRP